MSESAKEEREQRNIIILGASFAGISATHYILKNILPDLKAKNAKKDNDVEAKYHVYLLNPSTDFYFRSAASRFAASVDRLPADKILYDIRELCKGYASEDFTFIQATATGLDTAARNLLYKKATSELEEDALPYHALVIATGSRTGDPVFSMHTDTPTLLSAIKTRNAEIADAHDIIVSGGGPTGVEHAAEIGELLNGKPGWFGGWFGGGSKSREGRVKITLVTAAERLLPATRPAIGKAAEKQLHRLGVHVVYKTRVVQTRKTEGGKTGVMLSGPGSTSPSTSQVREVDLYIPAHGVLPNSSWLPHDLLDSSGWLTTNAQTLRVDNAGPRVYALGDITSFSRRTIPEILDSIPVLAVNLTRDLLSFSSSPSHSPSSEAKPKGKDRHLTQQTKTIQIVPLGSGGGVGEAFGWRFPSWVVWLVKGRDMMVWMAGATGRGERIKREMLKGEEGVF
ncbi:FAD/NAD(P)-binding domain-containing protein [Lophiostoma macrostomum CBS 122681]|uniref:FAD/NAD(P)-binding domain-containing protein n=1 Tax=Lophiostoma macrostomum CBS 122681 TaxID=1314788 RepID=A0A6A6T3I7_9PLEO|nr:FAD/NAD(P)-binding domain-containing protein [Lophiostoma macrostomum CBS 122681]